MRSFLLFGLETYPLGHVDIVSTAILIPSCDSMCEVRYSYVQKLESLVPLLNRLITIYTISNSRFSHPSPLDWVVVPLL